MLAAACVEVRTYSYTSMGCVYDAFATDPITLNTSYLLTTGAAALDPSECCQAGVDSGDTNSQLIGAC
jgi:hypothetical protein